MRLPNMPQNRIPVRVGVLLPFSNGSSSTRALAKSMMNAAQLALFDSHNPDILLMAGDEGSNPEEAARAARLLLAQGAEIIIGPLFASSVSAVAPLARDRGVPVVAFSTDRAVAGKGVYLLSFQPENDIRRIVSFTALQGHSNFAALIPRTAYGDHVLDAFRKEAGARKVHIAAVERFDASTKEFAAPARAVATSGADAILLAQGGTALAGLATAIRADDGSAAQAKLLGTGLWAERSLSREPALVGGWFAAPPPSAGDAFAAKYRSVFGANPPQLASLGYEAAALIVALAPGTPYHRFTASALTDPNGFLGVSGIFRFNPDGTCDRGLAVLSVEPDGIHVVDPAPRTFQAQAS